MIEGGGWLRRRWWTGDGDEAEQRAFEAIYQRYHAAPTEREAVYVLWRAVTGRLDAQVRALAVWATFSFAMCALWLFTLLVWPTLHSYQIDAGHDIIIHINRLTGRVEVIPLETRRPTS